MVLIPSRRLASITLALASISLHTPLRAESFPTHDQNPLLSNIGLATPWPTRFNAIGVQSLSATLNWSSTASILKHNTESLEMDVEGREWQLSWQYALTSKVTLRAQLPYQSFSGGSLDGFIDDWHSLFGLPEGARPMQSSNQYRIEYQRDGVIQLSDSRGTSNIGNLQVEAGYQAYVSERNATAVWLTSKLPTRKASSHSSLTTGNSAFDIGAGVSSEWQLHTHWALSVQGTLLRLGRADLLPSQQRRWLAQGFINVDYSTTPKLTLSAQFEVHSAAYRSDLPLLDSAWIMTLGGTYRLTDHWRAQLGVSEDIKVESSPDVNFLFSMTRTWR